MNDSSKLPTIIRKLVWKLDFKHKRTQKHKLGDYTNAKHRKKTTPRVLAKILGLVLIILFAIIYLMGLTYTKKQASKSIVYGVSFSIKQAESFNLDWRDNLNFLVNDSQMGFKKIRLMSYWDLHEQNQDQYDFSLLDEQLNIAQKNNAKVSLAIGMRQPRWPECHLPKWTNSLNPEQFDRELLEYIEIVVSRYKNHPSIESYQLENEAANRLFGDCPELNRELIAQEYELVKALDPQKPLIINASNQSGVPLRYPVGDKVGLSVYKKANIETPWGTEHYWSFWYIPAKWHSFKAQLITLLHNDEDAAFIHELQAEPWGDKPTHNLTIAEQDQSMNPKRLENIMKYADKIGANEVYLWGGEWWYWRKIKHNDTSIQSAVIDTIDNLSSEN